MAVYLGSDKVAGGGISEQEDTGWIVLEIADKFKPYVDAEINKPRCRKIGNIVQVQGELTPINEIEKTNEAQQFTMFSLPNDFIPEKEIVCIMQGSSMNKWCLRINVNGTVTCARYGTTTATNIPAGTWLPFNVTYFVD